MSSSSGRDGTGESSRSSHSGFARSLARLPSSIMEGLSRSIAHRAPRSRHRGIQIHQHQPAPEGPPLPAPPTSPPFVPEELFFFSAFEQQYGGHHPFFYGCRLSEVLAIARREGKHVFVYLHDPDHPYTEPFCRGTLCSDVVVEFLDANFVSWGAVSGRGEGSGMVAALQPGSFPFCAVVAPITGESITVLESLRKDQVQEQFSFWDVHCTVYMPWHWKISTCKELPKENLRTPAAGDDSSRCRFPSECDTFFINLNSHHIW